MPFIDIAFGDDNEEDSFPIASGSTSGATALPATKGLTARKDRAKSKPLSKRAQCITQQLDGDNDDDKMDNTAVVEEQYGQFFVYGGRKCDSEKKPSRNVGPPVMQEHEKWSMVVKATECIRRLKQDGRIELTSNGMGRRYALSDVASRQVVLLNGVVDRLRVLRQLQRQGLPHTPDWTEGRRLPGVVGNSFASLFGFAICSNVTANPMVKQSRTESTHFQWRRIDLLGLERAQFAQMDSTMFFLSRARGEHADIFDQVHDLPYAEYSLVPTAGATPYKAHKNNLPAILIASTGIYGLSMPTKLSNHNLLDEAKRWALLEIEEPGRFITNLIRADDSKIQALCKSILGVQSLYSPFWASIALVYYIKHHYMLRDRLQLDQLSLDVVDVLTRYACVEHTRRANYDKKLARNIDGYDQQLTEIGQSIEKCIDAIENGPEDPILIERMQQLAGRKRELTNNAHSARTVRRRNGGPTELTEETGTSSQNASYSRTSMGNTPQEILVRWITILNGNFTYVLSMIGSSQDVEVEYSTIQNVQMQLARLDASVSTEYETMLFDMFIRVAKNVTQLMRSLVSNAQMAPKIVRQTHNGKYRILRVNSDDEPLRVVAYSTTSSIVPTPSHMNILWVHESAVLPTKVEHGKHPIQMLQRQFQGEPTDSLMDLFPSLMSREQTPSRSFLTLFTRITETDNLLLNRWANVVQKEGPVEQPLQMPSHAPTGCRSFIGLGLRLNKYITSIHGTRPRPVRMALGVSTTNKSGELPIERERISPSPVLLVCDAQAKFDKVEGEEERHSVTYQVVGNKATRLVDFFCDNTRLIHHTSEAIAMLLVGAVQVAYTTQISVWCMPTSINSPMSNGMQVSRPDYMFAHLTAFELYLSGRDSIYRAMHGTPWESSTSAWVDVGVCTFGMNGSNYNDNRNPGTFYMSGELLAEYANLFASSCCVPIRDDYYAERPATLRGIPFGLIPGVHSALDTYKRGLMYAHKALALRANDRADVLVFPISPWAQQIGAFTKTSEWQLDSLPASVAESTRYRTLNPDNTDHRRAIAHSDRIVQPALIDVYNQVFNNGIEEVQSVFLLASMLAVIAKWVASIRGETAPTASFLQSQLRDYMGRPNKEHCDQDVNLTQSVNKCLSLALLCLSLIYPHTHANNDIIVHPMLAKTMSRCLQEGCAPYTLLTSVQYEQLMRWWCCFDFPTKANCVWETGISSIVDLHIRFNGTHDLSFQDYADMRIGLDNLIAGSYYFYSSNGTTPINPPNPLRGVTSPKGVMRDHVDGVFVVRYKRELETGACSGIVGVKMAQLQQVLSLAVMPLCVTPEEIQVRHCVGQMTVRFSSDAADAADTTIAKNDQSKLHTSKRTKQYSCIFSERDELAQGTLPERSKVCKAARKAWDFNLRQFLKAFTMINPPDTPVERARGDFPPEATRCTRVAHIDGVTTTVPDEQYPQILNALAEAAANVLSNKAT